MELKKISLSRGGRALFRDVNLVLAPGQKLGLLGPNGSGKSSFIQMITGKLPADSGEIARAELLKVVVFDQHRELLDQSQTLRRALSPLGDSVTFQGQSQHVSGWAQRFLFRREQLDLPVSELSGGEQARVLIARLMLRDADVLILDEPTNDLDIATLDVLEKSLDDFTGTVVLVTHDRYLLDRLTTELLALDGKGNAEMYIDLEQWERARETKRQEEASVKAAVDKPQAKATSSASAAKKKLTWNEQREFDGMEAAIHIAEAEVKSLHAQTTDPAVITDRDRLMDLYKRLGEAHQRVDQLFARWSELESKIT
jgi:ATP-binding cassette subfamily F protein uup